MYLVSWSTGEEVQQTAAESTAARAVRTAMGLWTTARQFTFNTPRSHALLSSYDVSTKYASDHRSTADSTSVGGSQLRVSSFIVMQSAPVRQRSPSSVVGNPVLSSPSGLSLRSSDFHDHEDDDALAITIPSTPSHFRSTASPTAGAASPSSRFASIVTPRLHHSPPASRGVEESPLTTDEVDELFAQLDSNGDRAVSKSDMRRALLVESQATQLSGGAKTVDTLLHHLWRLEGDVACSDSVDRQQFDGLVSRWRVPSQLPTTEQLDAKSRVYESELPIGRRLLAHWSVEGPMSTFVMAVVSLQIALGLYYFIHFADDPRIHVLGWGVAFAKLGAGVLYPSLALVLLSSSRRLATYLRQWRWMSKFINWDRSQLFHACLGVTILFFALLHALSHLGGTFVRAVGSTSPLLPNFPHPITYRALLRTRAGITGIIALSILLLIVAASLPRVRRSSFQLFQYTHLLIWPFVALLLVHGTGSLIQSPVLGYWLIVPMLAVLWDRVPRTVNMLRPVLGSTVRSIEDSTVMVSIPKSSVGWSYKPGQYILLRVQEVSFGQWHPFTIVGSTNSGGEMAGRLYVRQVGDWTGELLKRTQAGKTVTVTLDGPFGSPCDRLSNYDRVVIVGTGIGVTPYAGWLLDLTPQQTVDFHWVVRDRVSFAWFGSLINALHFRGEQRGATGVVNMHTYVTGRSPSTTLQHACRVLLEKHRTINHSTSFITGLECETRYGRPDIATIFQAAQRMKDKPADTDITRKLDDDTQQAHHATFTADEGSTRAGTTGDGMAQNGDKSASSAGLSSEAGSGKIGVFYCGPNYLGMEISDRCRMERYSSGTKWEFVGEVF